TLPPRIRLVEPSWALRGISKRPRARSFNPASTGRGEMMEGEGIGGVAKPPVPLECGEFEAVGVEDFQHQKQESGMNVPVTCDVPTPLRSFPFLDTGVVQLLPCGRAATDLEVVDQGRKSISRSGTA